MGDDGGLLRQPADGFVTEVSGNLDPADAYHDIPKRNVEADGDQIGLFQGKDTQKLTRIILCLPSVPRGGPMRLGNGGTIWGEREAW